VVFSGRSNRGYPLQLPGTQKTRSERRLRPGNLGFEIANSIFVSYSKRKRISGQQIAEYLSLLKSLPIRVEPRDIWANVDLESLARRHNLTAYDAAYLDLSLRANLALATLDETLRQAAAAEGIALLA
jgi:predicted nucleic acid-binding protein